jgi:hypothetical protein
VVKAAMPNRPTLRQTLGLAVVVAATCCARHEPALSRRHRLRAPPQAADRLIAAGAELVADYGASAWSTCPPDTLIGAHAAEGVEVRDDYHVVYLNSGRVPRARAEKTRKPRPLQRRGAARPGRRDRRCRR